MNYKEEIQKIIDEKGKKSCSKSIKNNEILWNEIVGKTSFITSNSIMERVNAYLQDLTSLDCENGNSLKYRDGKFVFCGRANSCLCNKQQISKNIKEIKSKRSKEDIKKENIKREETILKKSNGLFNNNGQSIEAKESRKLFYKDRNNITKQVTKHKNTLLKKYGVDNYSKTNDFKEKVKSTCLEKYGVDNPMKDDTIKKLSINNRSDNILNIDHFDKIKERLLKENNINILTSKEKYTGVANRPLWLFECNKCHNTFEKRFDYASLPICRNCNPLPISYKSNEEIELLNFIKDNYNGTIISGDRKILKGMEIDIVLPEINLAIEYCGLYWHSENSSGKKYNYHYNKYKICKDNDIQLLTIFSDEWNLSKEIVKNCILSKIKKQKRIYARKCIAKTLSKKEAKEFLDKYHLQGASGKVSESIGLFYSNELVGVMSFLVKNNVSELVRFASKNEIIGGASKLLKFYIKNNTTIVSIVSFSDNRWSNGNLYKTLGFTIVSEVPPMQYYVEKYQKRYHKRFFYKGRLNKLISSNFGTEWEKLQKLGYDRIWDCGKIKYELKL